MTIAEAARDFPATLRRVRRTRKPVVIESRGKAVAVMAPPDLFSKMEDDADVLDAERVIEKARRAGEKPVSYKQARRDLGLA